MKNNANQIGNEENQTKSRSREAVVLLLLNVVGINTSYSKDILNFVYKDIPRTPFEHPTARGQLPASYSTSTYLKSNTGDKNKDLVIERVVRIAYEAAMRAALNAPQKSDASPVAAADYCHYLLSRGLGLDTKDVGSIPHAKIWEAWREERRCNVDLRTDA